VTNTRVPMSHYTIAGHYFLRASCILRFSMARLKVFISYGRKHPESVELVKKLDEDLREAGYEPWWDRRIPAATEWDRQIDEWIATCHAGLVLVSGPAVESGWIFKEADRLHFRKLQDPRFKLLPVLPYGVTQKVLEHDLFAKIGLGELENRNIEDSDQSSAPIIEWLRSLEFWHHSDEPENKLCRKIAGCLLRAYEAHYTIDLEEACRRMEVSYNGLLPEVLCQGTAEALLRTNLSVFIKLLEDSVLALPRDDMERLVEWVTPFAWVGREAAASIARMAEGGSGREIRLNGKEPDFTPGQYIGRAGCHQQDWITAQISGVAGEGVATGLVDECRKVLARELDLPEVTDLAELNSEIRYLREKGEQIFLIVPLTLNDQAVIAQLGRSFPGVVLFCLVGVDGDLASATAGSDGNEALVLGLALDVEKAAYRDYRRARRLASRSA